MYAIELPKELLWRLARLRERNRKPIRSAGARGRRSLLQRAGSHVFG